MLLNDTHRHTGLWAKCMSGTSSLQRTYHFAVILILMLSVISATDGLSSESTSIQILQSISLQNDQIKNLRKDVRKTIYTTKSRRNPEELPHLEFYKYTVKKNENFWKILARTSQNIDTLMSLNNLSSPRDIHPGKVLYIPNMRGIIYDNKRGKSVDEICSGYRIHPSYVKKINRVLSGTKRYLFIPNGEISRLERSLFLGTGFASPLKSGRRTSGFGNRLDPFKKTISFHSGIDFACPVGTRIYSTRSGKVQYAGYRGNYGLLVIIKHHHSYYSYYGHLSRALVKKGTVVKRGQLIALSGNTGRSTGPHLHFEVRKKSRAVNPGILLRP
jgi:murein DD-endopeptidase MepM/ murein hydrolase activator NlpD